MNKYNNKKTFVNGIKFDSIKESKRYLELQSLVLAGAIDDLELQPRFEIVPQHKFNGKTQAKRSYVADFKYNEGNNIVVEDVKGFQTAMYRLKRSLFLTQYPQYKFIET